MSAAPSLAAAAIRTAYEEAMSKARARLAPAIGATGLPTIARRAEWLRAEMEDTTHDPVPEGRLMEIFFSIIQKKVVTPNDFASLNDLSGTLLAFTSRYNQTARPFNWNFTAAGLTALLRRISEREQQATGQPDLAMAA